MTEEEFGKRVREALDNNGMRYSYMAKQLGISRQLFDTRMKGKGWTIDEISKTIKVLNLPSDILSQ